MSVVFTVALTLLVSYLLGCFNGSVMTSHFIIRDDVRQHGSGNAGLTNFYRTYGARYALCVIICDMGKTVLACLIGGYLMHWVVGDWTLGLLIAGIGCELGHMFPVFFGLRGGKGILSGGVLVLLLDWRVALIAWGLFAVLWLTTRYVSLGSVTATASMPVSRPVCGDSGPCDLVPPGQHPVAAVRHRKEVSLARRRPGRGRGRPASIRRKRESIRMKNNQLRQVVFPILAAFIWGTAFVAQDVCADAMGAFTFNGARYYIAVLSLLVVLAVSSGFRKDRPQISPAEKKAQRRQLWLGGFCCGTVLAIASNFQQAGLVAGTDGGKAGFITALYVVLVPVFGLFFRRRVSLPVWIAVALSVGALYLLCIKGSFSLAPGDLLVLVCAICFSVHILVIDHFTATCDGVKLSCLQFLFAGTWSTILALFFDTISFQVLLDCIWPLLYVGVFSCGVGYTLQILAQKGSNPTVVTILLSLESVFAVIAGAVVLHQQMTAREYLGCVLMFAAVILAQIPMPQKKKAKAE